MKFISDAQTQNIYWFLEKPIKQNYFCKLWLEKWHICQLSSILLCHCVDLGSRGNWRERGAEKEYDRPRFDERYERVYQSRNRYKSGSSHDDEEGRSSFPILTQLYNYARGCHVLRMFSFCNGGKPHIPNVFLQCAKLAYRHRTNTIKKCGGL